MTCKSRLAAVESAIGGRGNKIASSQSAQVGRGVQLYLLENRTLAQDAELVALDAAHKQRTGQTISQVAQFFLDSI